MVRGFKFVILFLALSLIHGKVHSSTLQCSTLFLAANAQKNIEQNKHLVSQYIESEFQRMSSLDDYPEMIKSLSDLINLVKEMSWESQSNAIKKSGIDAGTLQFVRENAKGLVSARELLKIKEIEGSFTLGLSFDGGYRERGNISSYRVFVDGLNLIHYGTSYNLFKIAVNGDDHVNQHLEKITSTEKNVIFFVPNDFCTFCVRDTGITKREFQWLLDHPDRMKKVIFVFGAYDLVTSEMYEASDGMHVKSGLQDVLQREISRLHNRDSSSH